MKLFFFILTIFFITANVRARPNFSSSTSKSNKDRVCGYDGCPVSKPDMINVHMVPHTHDDAGWLKTFDQYFYGSQNTIQKAGVEYIIDSVIQELIKDPEKRFIYVESSFFSMWWKIQTPELQEKVKELVNEGRLEFIGGAWSMNDEAGVHYNSVVDHFTWGLKFLSDNFGTCGRPKIGWQIDPFGHSREQASLFAQMGYDGMFFGRIDYQDKENRLKNKEMEMIWHANNNLGESSDIFAGCLHNLYQPPSGFCFDILCDETPIIDNPKSADYNVIERVDTFFEFVRNQSENYRTNNVIMTMGGDFTYMDANVYYKNMDKLIRYANDRQEGGSNINLFYSTPSCYLKALHDADITWPEKSDDFFPYASDLHSYWTGYFTSRPTQKRFERMGNHFLQACKQLTSFAIKHNDEFIPNLNELREIMGIMQHHDAITGTEKQKVAQDYARTMTKGIGACASNVKSVLNQLTTRQTNEPEENPFTFTMCPFMNISSCAVSEKSDTFIVTVYNLLAHSTFEYITVPVVGDKYIVKDYRNVEIKHQILTIPQTVKDYDMRKSEATHQCVFLAPEIPAMGFKGFYITKLDSQDEVNDSKENVRENSIINDEVSPNDDPDEKVTIGNKYFTLTFDEYGLLELVNTTDGVEHRLAQNFFYYEGYLGNNWIPKNRSSGAYIFRPNGTERFVTSRASIEVVRGDHVEEVRQVFNEWISQIIRVYREENHIEFEWMVGPIPVEDGIGKEVVSRFYSTINNDGVFYTDSNGRQMIKRTRNHRDSWNVNIGEAVAGNYYPVTAKIMIEDDEDRLAVLNDRAQGGSSIFDGTVELMVHRRLLKDDAFGVGEPLNETEASKGLVARGKHWVIIGSKSDSHPLGWTLAARERFLQNEKLLSPIPFFSDASGANYSHWMERYSNIWSVMALPLPRNLHVLTFEPWNQDKLNGHSYLVRFEHLFEKDEDPVYSQPIKFNFQDAFRDFDVAWIRETTLAGNQWLEDAKRFKFKPDSKKDSTESFSKYESMMRKVTEEDLEFIVARSLGGEVNKMADNARSAAFDHEIILEPMQIRTYVVKMNPDIYDK